MSPGRQRDEAEKEMLDQTNAHTALLQQTRQCEQSAHAVRVQCGVASWLRSLAGGVAAKRREWGMLWARRWQKKKPKRGVRARSQRARKVRTFII